MYESEKSFAVALMNKCRKRGFDVMRVESASTISGCPDVWLQYSGDDWWLELKNSDAALHGQMLRVDWRPGQIGWAMRYKNNHQYFARYNGVHFLVTKCSWTVVAARDAYVFYRMRDVPDEGRPKRHVDVGSPDAFVMSKREYSALDVYALLSQHSYVVTPVFSNSDMVCWGVLFDAWKYAWLDVCRHLDRWKGLNYSPFLLEMDVDEYGRMDPSRLGAEAAVEYSEKVLRCMPGYRPVTLASNLLRD